MKRSIMATCIAVLLLLSAGSLLRAEVKTEEKSLAKFEGMMGRMMGMFGGKVAKEGILNTVSVKGNRKMTVNDTTGEIVDLDEQKVYTLDMKKKSYETLTFDEMRRRMEEARKKAEQAMQEDRKKPSQSDKEMDVEFSLKESGQKKAINGYDCREVIMTISVHEKGKTLEQAGGVVMTNHLWLAPRIPEMKEIADFDMRYWKALQLAGMAGPAEQMAMMAAMYPGMKEMMARMQSESVNLDGTAILTETVSESVVGTEQASQESPRQERESSGGITSMRGIGGMLGRRAAKPKEEPGAKSKDRVSIYTFTHELIKVSTSVSSSDVAVPAGFKEKK